LVLVIFSFKFPNPFAILPEIQISGGAMRGNFDPQPMMIAFIDLEKRVLQDHPLCKIKSMADQELHCLSSLPYSLGLPISKDRPSVWP
jgi:hypothetical protein